MGSDLLQFKLIVKLRISIHAPRVGSDVLHFGITCASNKISIHAPRVGSDPAPTPDKAPSSYFNPRSPCGERPVPVVAPSGAAPFQSTLPVWGATEQCYALAELCEFQSTLPVWGATRSRSSCASIVAISIHAPRVGSDPLMRSVSPAARYFNPRSPCGERLDLKERENLTYIFQSTLPVWGATPAAGCAGTATKISIHAPRVGSDSLIPCSCWSLTNFNPRSPCGERPVELAVGLDREQFQSTLPVWGATPLPVK